MPNIAPTADPAGKIVMAAVCWRFPRRAGAISPWVVAVAVVIPTFMEVLDTTIANVALRYIAGGLSAAGNRQRMGHHQLPRGQRDHPADLRLARRGWAGGTIFCSDRVVHFRFGDVRDGQEPEQLIAFRVLQGLAGGGLQPSSQGVLLDAFPREKQGRR